MNSKKIGKFSAIWEVTGTVNSWTEANPDTYFLLCAHTQW